MAHRDSSSAPPAGGGLADRLEDQASDFAMVGITSASRDLDFEVPSPLSSGRTGAPRTAFSAFFGRSGSSKESGGEPGSPSKRGMGMLDPWQKGKGTSHKKWESEGARMYDNPSQGSTAESPVSHILADYEGKRGASPDVAASVPPGGLGAVPGSGGSGDVLGRRQ